MSAKQTDSKAASNCDTTTLHERLLELQRRCSGVVGFDSVNPHFKNKYASLETVLEKLLPVANEIGLIICQKIAWVDGFWCVRTIVMDGKTSEEMSCMPIINLKGDAQGFGSALSYAKRYSLMAAFAMVGGLEDDDAEATTSPRTPLDNKPKKVVSYQGTQADMTRLAGMMREAGIIDQHDMRKVAARCTGRSWEDCDLIVTEEAALTRGQK